MGEAYTLVVLSPVLALGCRRDHMVWCPGCEGLHPINVEEPSRSTGSQWSWNNSAEKPTYSPSLLIRRSVGSYVDGKWVETGKHVCHSYIRDGVWEFLGDCTHKLAGHKVALPPLPDWYVED